MTDESERVRAAAAKVRKLAALAAPDSGTTAAERESALETARRICDRHGLDPARFGLPAQADAEPQPDVAAVTVSFTAATTGTSRAWAFTAEGAAKAEAAFRDAAAAYRAAEARERARRAEAARIRDHVARTFGVRIVCMCGRPDCRNPPPTTTTTTTED